ncbi:hypothetical protein HYS92_02780 [Candidatus Daviesbacteria bacterium]|nr:hypothetical protein [Candidatus Daviesbacteria bacterium]
MAYLKVVDFKKLRAFLWALNTSKFNLSKLPTRDDQGTFVDKTFCLNLLRSFPEFQGEKFKDDNFLIRHLSNPGNMRQIMDQFTPSQQMEVAEVLKEKPVVVGAMGEQPIVQEEAATLGETSLPNIPMPSGMAQSEGTRVAVLDKPTTKTTPDIPSTAVRPIQEETPSTMVSPTEKQAASTKTQSAPKTSASTSTRTYGASTSTNPTFQTPKIPSSVLQAGKSFTSRSSIFFQRNFGKYLTGGNIATLASGGIGALVGTGVGAGNPFAAAAGGVGGVGFKHWVTSGRAGPALTRFGNGIINIGNSISSQISGPRASAFKKTTKKRFLFLILGFFILFGTVAAISVPPPSPTSPTTSTGSATTPGSTLPADASSCPIPNGQITCGSLSTPASNGCGHCNEVYKQAIGEAEFQRVCGMAGTKYGIDIAGADLQEVYLPKINGRVIKWAFKSPQEPGSPFTQRYTGIDEQTNEKYMITFHHTNNGSGNPGEHLSGERGARICGDGCNQKHVHVELSSGAAGAGGMTFLDTPSYLCR